MTGNPTQRSEDLARLTQATIMVVDRNLAILAEVRTALERAGFAGVIMATLDFDALNPVAEMAAMIATRQPDVLLLGHGPADAIGMSLLDHLRDDERWRDLPIILMVDDAPPTPNAVTVRATVRRQALNLGATDILDQPIDGSELTLRLRNALGYQVMRDRLLKHDALTGLANRAEFIRRVRTVLQGADPANAPSRSLLMLNLDRFKQINDSLGHQVGDDLLKAVAERLSSVIARHAGADRRSADPAATPWLARIEGDRFMALLPGRCGDPQHDACIAQIVAVLARPHHLHGRELVVSASIGLATSPSDGMQAEGLLERAELAAAVAKKQGGDRVEYFSGEFEIRAAERLMLESHLRQAIRRDELCLFYQPKVDCATGRIVGVEALIRWQHPQLGLIAPDQFIPIAEATGLIVEIGAWVLDEACRQGRQWQEAGFAPLQVSVNLSAGQTIRGDIVGTLTQTLASTGFPAERLTLELTESLLMAPGDRAVRVIGELKSLGISISLDDFGTGFSSLTYLRRFPIDEIKIDRSFVRGLPDQRDSIAITRAIIALADSLDLQVVAEGVESAAELAFLQQFKSCLFQGFLFSRPLPGVALTALLREAMRSGR